MKAYELGTLNRAGDRMDSIAAVRAIIQGCDFAYLAVGSALSVDQATDLVLALTNGKPVVLGDSDDVSGVNTHLLVRDAGHCIGMLADRSSFVWLAGKMVEHAQGERLHVVFADDLLACLRLAESPIEERLAVHMSAAISGASQVQAQAEIVAGQTKYRADFLISDEESGLRIVVECDGHDFHERTKEQASRDKKRDRDMLAAGYRVMRFTGSEIWRAPKRCADEVASYVWGNL
jgi:very-short-patch-repair endonuclease